MTCEYTLDKGACVPTRVHTVVISVQHSEEVTLDQLRSDLMEKVVNVVIPHKFLDENTIYHIQPSGRFVIGGPQVRPPSNDHAQVKCRCQLRLLVRYDHLQRVATHNYNNIFMVFY